MMDINEYIQKGTGMVTLCGSTRFYEECKEAERLLTMQGWFVLKSGSFDKNAPPMTPEQNKVVKWLHFQKITQSQLIVVVSRGERYLGDSSRLEVGFAEHYGFPVCDFDGKEFKGSTDWIPLKYYRDNGAAQEFFDKYDWAKELAVKTGMM